MTTLPRHFSHHRNRPSTRLHALAIIVMTLICLNAETQSALAVQTNKPNIVFINFDDADMDILSEANLEEHYPTLAALARRSTVFTNAHATTPFCAPSRAALFTGKYAFNNGCKIGVEGAPVSNGFDGGYQRFIANGHHENELGTWMQAAGYRTMHVGKFHHNGFNNQVPPGWDDFSATRGIRFFNTARYSNIAFSPARAYQAGADTYVSTIDRDDAITALGRHFSARPNQPFLLSLAPIAPHTPPERDLTLMVEPRYRNYASDLSQPTNDPDYDEADVSDKPSHLQRGRLTNGERRYFNELYLARLRSVKSVDDMLADIFARITAAGKMDNTYIILSSDNGFQLGHHRFFAKKDPFNRSTNVPLMVAGPRIRRASVANHLIAHIDICPTILEMGRADIPTDVDGKSFFPVAQTPTSVAPRAWQRSIMIENWSDKNGFGNHTELVYTAERYFDSIYVGWANGEREYYNLTNDPFQLENQYGNLAPPRQEQLQASLRNFRQAEVQPNLTLLTPQRGDEITDQITFSGQVEDNSAAVAALVTIRSVRTNRYFNGTDWQDTFTAIPVPTEDPTNNVSDWKTTIGVFSELNNEVDFLLSWAHPLDDRQKRGELVWTFNVMRDRSLYGQFNPTINGRTFPHRTIQLRGFHGRYPDTTVQLSVMNVATGQYFNGNALVDEEAEIGTTPQDGGRWLSRLVLPSGDYRAALHVTAGEFRREDLEFVDFTVR